MTRCTDEVKYGVKKSSLPRKISPNRRSGGAAPKSINCTNFQNTNAPYGLSRSAIFTKFLGFVDSSSDLNIQIRTRGSGVMGLKLGSVFRFFQFSLPPSGESIRRM